MRERVDSPAVACLGECMIELVERPDGTLSRGFGGDTLNTAIYLARLGVAVDYATALGTDAFSQSMLDAWTEEGVGTQLVLRLPGRLPGLYLIRTDALGERQFFYWRDSAPARQVFALPETPELEAALLRCDLLYLSGISLSLYGMDGRARLAGLLDRLRARGGRVAFDTNYRPRGWPNAAVARTAYDQVLARSDIVLASVEDEMLMSGSDDADALASRIAACGVAEIVVKTHLPGAVVHHAGPAVTVPTTSVAATDTTAAGDSFAAGYLAARLAGHSPVAAARAGHHLAGHVVRHRGAIIPRQAMPVMDTHR